MSTCKAMKRSEEDTVMDLTSVVFLRMPGGRCRSEENRGRKEHRSSEGECQDTQITNTPNSLLHNFFLIFRICVTHEGEEGYKNVKGLSFFGGSDHSGIRRKGCYGEGAQKSWWFGLESG